MSDVIAAPSVRALALRQGIDLETLARDLGRTTIAREDLSGASGGTSSDEPSGNATSSPVRALPLAGITTSAPWSR